MFIESNPYKRYRQTQVETAGPLELIIMMYDGAIRFCNQAKGAIKRIIIMKLTACSAGADIVDELNFSLNMEAGEIANRLRSLYDFINSKLIEANVNKILLLSTKWLNSFELRSSWSELQHGNKK